MKNALGHGRREVAGRTQGEAHKTAQGRCGLTLETHLVWRLRTTWQLGETHLDC